MLSLKLSLLLLYLRIFAPDKVTRYLIYVGMTFCFLAYTVLMFLNIFSDVETVIDTNKALGAVNLFSDIYILCVPTTAISKLQLSVRKKIGVMLVFMTGIMYVVSLLVAKEEVNLLTSPQRLCNEYGKPHISTPSTSNGGRCHVPFSGDFPSHVRVLNGIKLPATADFTQNHRRRGRSHVRLHAFLPSHREELTDPPKMHPLGPVSGIVDPQIEPP